MKKNKKKRGRPRIKGRVREPNGRISRAKTPREPVDQLAIEMRAKRFGLTLQDAKNPLAGTYIGRLCLKGELTQEQYDAAQQYLQIRNNYLCAKGLLGAVYDLVLFMMMCVQAQIRIVLNSGFKKQPVIIKACKRH